MTIQDKDQDKDTAQNKNTAPADFDPFSLISIFSPARNLNSWLLVLPIGIAIISLVLVASAIDGTLGNWHNFQFWTDLKRALNVAHTPSSQPYFPVMRDVTTWLLAFIVVASCGVAHRQWQLMSHCLSDLFKNGVLRPKPELKKSLRSRVLKLDHFVGNAKGPAAYNAFVNNVNQSAAVRIARWAPFIAAVSAFIVILLIIGEKHTLFAVFAPHGLNSSSRSGWLSTAYKNWWASDDHPAGLLVYFIGCFLGAYVLVVVNIIGVLASYVIAALPYLTEFDIDWLNRDGNFGWMPVKRVFRTIYSLLILHGSVISILLIVLGIQNFPWIIILVAVWIIVVPIYVIVPAVMFHNMIDRARNRRASELAQAANCSESLTIQNLGKFRTFVLEMERIRKAKIRPTSPAWLQTPTVVVAVLLPIILTIAQILFSGKVWF
jgi:hypothetical protein